MKLSKIKARIVQKEKRLNLKLEWDKTKKIKMSTLNKFDPNQKVSSYLALIFLLVLSAAVAWISVIKGGEVVSSVKESEAFNLEKRRELLEMDNSKKDKQLNSYEKTIR